MITNPQALLTNPSLSKSVGSREEQTQESRPAIPPSLHRLHLHFVAPAWHADREKRQGQ
ncbi:MAG: hypothetical protein U0872_14710 [Planctomycetaceae bacterium]